MLKHFGQSLLAAVFLMAGALGCSSSDTLEVTGQVTFDGAAVEKGEVSFVPLDRDGAADGGVIENGTFKFQSKPGSKRVEIRASRPLPPERQTQPEMGQMYEDYIPAHYNRESTLTADVSATGDRHYPFELTSQPP